MQKLQQALGDSILIVGIDDESADTVREFVQDRGFTWTFVLDPYNEAALACNVSAIPTSVFIDAKGVIVRQFVGQQDYETFLEAAREAIGDWCYTILRVRCTTLLLLISAFTFKIIRYRNFLEKGVYLNDKAYSCISDHNLLVPA